MKIKIILADDQALIRDGLKTILNLEEDLEVIATAENGREAFELAGKLVPDILLLDIRMPEMDGVECIRKLRNINTVTKVIMLTTFNEDDYILNAIAAGAKGYLLKDMEVSELIEAIHDAAKEKLVMPSKVVTKLAESLLKVVEGKNKGLSTDSFGFSDREKEIAKMLSQGFHNRQIAAFLYISEGTVRNYISSIYYKIGVNDRTQAVLFLRDYFTE
ncbi:response regulator transcription factor [Anaerocolumna sp. AGMB13025]|uniref:response regulator n=1 Tax=Anaerocolumna sp. AGMB13025 TaxID=3039116 RepID=UPI00241F9E18|nr:response regulator transcription factor [Anaerocolumna sp. AGMB13025]WFR58050.1 response regulator transcription factor [Anaerocolumna sp. AGMB13025]